MNTPVIFKMEGRGKDSTPVAFFPDVPANYDPSDCTCYAHTGQHSAATVAYARLLKPATVEQYKPLLDELHTCGYDDLTIVHKFTRAHFEARRAEIKRLRGEE